jgi:8-oxo-dGTP diphosphatase
MPPTDPPPLSLLPAGVDWGNWQPTMRATLLFIRRGPDEILLMRKKRGLGAGKINAPGGKLDPGESPIACAVREAHEELCVTAEDPEHRGLLRFQFTDGLAIHCDVFVASRFHGEPTETDEGAPLWCRTDAIPYAEMWADDAEWLPGLLAGRRFTGQFLFDGESMQGCHIHWI